MKNQKRFPLFPNGIEFMLWQGRNCDRCIKAVFYDEQKYKEALANARQEYNTTENVERKQWLEDLFPELAESENERIRKAIIDIVKSQKEQQCHINGAVYDKMLAWLEKQGNPTDINPSEFDLHLNKLLKQFETLPKEELVSSLSFYLNVVQNDGTYKEEKESEQKLPIGKLPSGMKTIGESLGFTTQEECDKYNQMVTDLIMSDDGKSEQKPTDKEMKELLRTEYEKGRADAIAEMQKPTWSEEDETIADNLAWAIANDKIRPQDRDDYCDWLRTLKDRVLPQPKQEWNEEDERMFEKILQQFTTANNNCKLQNASFTYDKEISFLKSLKDRVQPKQEWSEDDEIRLDRICKTLWKNRKGDTDEIYQQEQDVDWLKSIRPQNTWKPSDEQIFALADALSLAKSCGEERAFDLRTLYEELKKLKG